jgi:hypothetical protein
MSTTDTNSDDFRVLIHELGHAEACIRFNIPCQAVVFPPDARPVNPASIGGVMAGVCRMVRSGTPYQNSVIGWSGVLAEIITGVPNPVIDPGLPLRADTLREVYGACLVSFDKLSLPDQTLICGFRRSHWQTYRASWELLRSKKGRLLRLAKMKCNPPPTPMNQNKQPGLSPHYRARVLQNFLANLAQDHPDRPGWEAMLEKLKRGEELPAELFPPALANPIPPI